jgi:hypothetical protein
LEARKQPLFHLLIFDPLEEVEQFQADRAVLGEEGATGWGYLCHRPLPVQEPVRPNTQRL